MLANITSDIQHNERRSKVFIGSWGKILYFIHVYNQLGLALQKGGKNPQDFIEQKKNTLCMLYYQSLSTGIFSKVG